MKDEQFMRIEIEEAKKGTFPFGAVIVKGEEVIAKGHNLVEENDPTAHGEIGAIRNACKVLRTMSFAGCTLYTTCEPCTMCFMASWWAQISKIVWDLGGAKTFQKMIGK